MLITPCDQHGTIGGGRLEWDAVKQARRMLEEGGADYEQRVALGPEISQCCGGAVVLRFETIHDLAALEVAEQVIRARLPVLLLFGAGHVGRALARALALLPLRLVWIDARADSFGPVPPGVDARVTGDWAAMLADGPPGVGVVVMTQSHALDALIVEAALMRGDCGYIGLIGSRTKRRLFERGFAENGLSDDCIAKLVCPIGDRGVRDKRPESIAALVAAELVERFLN